MKRYCLGGGFLLLSLGLCLGQNPDVPRLTGIVCFSNYTVALVELDPSTAHIRMPLLRVGERDANYEVLRIDEREGIVSFADKMKSTTMDLQILPTAPLAGRSLHLQNARLLQVLDVFQQLAGCTILRSQNVPEIKFNLETPANLSFSQAAMLLESALLQHGLLVKRQGNFIFVGRPDEAAVINSLVPPLQSAVQKQPLQISEIFPPGLIKFSDADAFHVLDVYAELADRTILQPARLGAGKVSIRSQSSMSRQDAVWLMEASLRLAGVCLTPENGKFMYAASPTQTNGLPRFDEKVYSARIASPTAAGMSNLVNATPAQLLEKYALLVARQPEPLRFETRWTWINLRPRKTLTRAESLFALEALAYLNNWRFNSVGENRVALVSTARGGK